VDNSGDHQLTHANSGGGQADCGNACAGNRPATEMAASPALPLERPCFIDLQNEGELRYWSASFGMTETELVPAVHGGGRTHGRLLQILVAASEPVPG
jgi:hypothetical protein